MIVADFIFLYKIKCPDDSLIYQSSLIPAAAHSVFVLASHTED